MVMGLFDSKCPHCGNSVQRGAPFCSSCGKALSGGELACGVCGAKNRADASFCTSCGRPLAVSAAPDVQRQHWSRGQNDFAVRIEANDLPGLLNKGLVVEPGTNAMLVERGENKGLVPPGNYRIENLFQKGWDLIKGEVPRSVTALLVDVTPTDLDFHLGGRFSKDPLPVGLSTRVVVEVGDPGKFLVNVLKGRERYTVNDLREYLYPEVVQVVDRWLREHTLAELAEDASLRERLELALEQALKRTFQQSGLIFLQARTVELNLEPYDEIKGVRGKYALLDARASAELEGRRHLVVTEDDTRRFDEETRLRRAEEEARFKTRWSDLQHSQDLQALVEQTRKVELDERKLDLNERMRRAVLADKIKEVQSEQEFEAFLSKLDYEKLYKEKERAELLRGWKDTRDDQDRSRAFFLAKSDVEREYELRAIRAGLQHGVNLQDYNNEIELARKRTDYEFDLRRRSLEEEILLENRKIDIQRRRDEIEAERLRRKIEMTRLQRDFDLDNTRRTRTLEREEDEADAQMGLRLLSQMKENRRKDEEDIQRIKRLDEEETLRIRRVDDLERNKVKHEQEMQLIEIGERKRQADLNHQAQMEKNRQEFELRRQQQMGQFGPDALIATADPEQSRNLTEFKKAKELQALREEIEKDRVNAQNKTNQEIKELNERLLREKDEAIQRGQDENERRIRDNNSTWDIATSRSKETTDRSIDTIGKVVDSLARSLQGQPPSQPIIIVPQGGSSGGPQVIQPSGGPPPAPQADAKKTCPDCGMFVPVQAKFCEHCGHPFKGV